jgi:hypothetical protein
MDPLIIEVEIDFYLNKDRDTKLRGEGEEM